MILRVFNNNFYLDTTLTGYSEATIRVKMPPVEATFKAQSFWEVIKPFDIIRLALIHGKRDYLSALSLSIIKGSVIIISLKHGLRLGTMLRKRLGQLL